VLLTVLCMQAILSVRMHNTAFEDEALYLYSGRLELGHLLHAAPLQGGFSSYFSGAPVLYPVLAAAADRLGGLTAARAVSLIEMLATTALLYSLTRRLFNERVGLCAAVLFAVTEPAIFLGSLATYDASALCLLAIAAWIAVRTAHTWWPVLLLAAPVAALAVATKYAALLYVPAIILLYALAAWPRSPRRALAYSVLLAAAIAGLLAGALRLAGPTYLQAIQGTTLARAQGTTAVTTLLKESLLWGGPLFVLALAGTVAYARRAPTEPGGHIAAGGGRLRRISLGVVLSGTALLAPAVQLHLHTDVSFQKHIGFGLFFAAPMAGMGLARIVGDHFRRAQIGVAVWGLVLLLGMVQASQLFTGWPDSRPLTSALSGYLRPGARYLVEVPEVPIYYLMGRPDAQPRQFTSTFVIAYTDSHGQTLTGTPGFVAAIRDGYFQVVAYNGTVTPEVDGAIARALQTSGSYRLARVVLFRGAFARAPYYIWVKR
jgi:4-amino-4-deoxy-L-arabinose transferase-like glycosyltransferase